MPEITDAERKRQKVALLDPKIKGAAQMALLNAIEADSDVGMVALHPDGDEGRPLKALIVVCLNPAYASAIDTFIKDLGGRQQFEVLDDRLVWKPDA